MKTVLFDTVILENQIAFNELKDFITTSKFNMANYQLVLLKSVIENEKPITKDLICRNLLTHNLEFKKELSYSDRIKSMKKTPVFLNTRFFFKRNIVLRSHCGKWLKLNIELNPTEKSDLLSLIESRLNKS